MPEMWASKSAQVLSVRKLQVGGCVMPRCRSCGTQIGCDRDSGHYEAETGEFVCDGCYDPLTDKDREWDNFANDSIQDSYEATEKTAPLTDIGGCE